MKPWLSDDIRALIKRKHFLLRQYNKNSEISLDEYNRYKNYVTGTLRRAKRDYFVSKFDACRGNIRKT